MTPEQGPEIFEPEREGRDRFSSFRKPETRGNPPFASERELLAPEKSYRLSEFADHPGWIVRESNIKPYEEGGGYSLERWKQVFHVLRDVYNISIPDSKFTVGADGRGHKRMFTLTRKVEGVALDDDVLLPRVAAAQIENLYRNFARYLVDKYNEGVEYYSDFKPSQLMYGRTADDKQDRVYLVDLDLLSRRFEGAGEPGRHPKIRLLAELRFLLKDLDELAEKFSPRYQFESARRLIEDYLNEVDQEMDSQYA